MARCDLCVKFDNCPWRYDPDAMCSAFKRKPMSNADRIRAMTDEELADIVRCVPEYTDCPKGADDCRECILDWLRKEVEE